MVGKRIVNIDEIIAFINVCTKLGHSIMQMFTELEEVMGPIRYLIRQFVGRWTQKLAQSVKVAAKSDRLVTITLKVKVSKLGKQRKAMADVYTICDIAKADGILQVHFI